MTPSSRARRPSAAQPASRSRARGRRADDSAAPTPTAPGPLTHGQRRYLRGLCHHLKPVILLGGKGVTTAVKAELDLSLDHHELIKVKLSGADRDQRQRQLEDLLQASGAELVQQVGHVASLFRRNADKPRLALPR